MNDYKVLVDYGSEGLQWANNDGFETVNEAVKDGIRELFGHDFYVVKIIDWVAK